MAVVDDGLTREGARTTNDPSTSLIMKHDKRHKLRNNPLNRPKTS
jgi:hypothetical protein